MRHSRRTLPFYIAHQTHGGALPPGHVTSRRSGAGCGFGVEFEGGLVHGLPTKFSRTSVKTLKSGEGRAWQLVGTNKLAPDIH